MKHMHCARHLHMPEHMYATSNIPVNIWAVCLAVQEEELKAAMDKAVEAETRASEAEIRMKEMKVRLKSCWLQHITMRKVLDASQPQPNWPVVWHALAMIGGCELRCSATFADCRRPLMPPTKLLRSCRSSCNKRSSLQLTRPARLLRCMLWRFRRCWWSAQSWR